MANQFTQNDTPIEKSLGFINPILAQEWSALNEKSAFEVYESAAGEYLWDCPKGHQWKASPNHRKQNIQCRVCKGKQLLSGFNDLASIYPELALEFDEDLNKKAANQATARASDVYYWKCFEGHQWKDSVTHRIKDNVNCQTCQNKILWIGVNDLKSMFPELAQEWHPNKNGSLTPTDVKYNDSKKHWWICAQGHEWQATASNRYRGRGCKGCKWQGASEQERVIFRYLQAQNIEVEQNVWLKFLENEVVIRQELDFLLKEPLINIEYDGFYWHLNSLERDIVKSNRLLQNGYYVIRIRDSRLASLNITHPHYFEAPHVLEKTRTTLGPLALKLIRNIKSE